MDIAGYHDDIGAPFVALVRHDLQHHDHQHSNIFFNSPTSDMSMLGCRDATGTLTFVGERLGRIRCVKQPKIYIKKVFSSSKIVFCRTMITLSQIYLICDILVALHIWPRNWDSNVPNNRLSLKSVSTAREKNSLQNKGSTG